MTESPSDFTLPMIKRLINETLLDHQDFQDDLFNVIKKYNLIDDLKKIIITTLMDQCKKYNRPYELIIDDDHFKIDGSYFKYGDVQQKSKMLSNMLTYNQNINTLTISITIGEGMVPFLKRLETNTTIKHLILSTSSIYMYPEPIKDTFCDHLCTLLVNNNTIVSIQFDNMLPDYFINRFIDHLVHESCTLISIGFSHHFTSPQQKISMLKAIKKNASLQSINLNILPNDFFLFPDIIDMLKVNSNIVDIRMPSILYGEYHNCSDIYTKINNLVGKNKHNKRMKNITALSVLLEHLLFTPFANPR